MNVVILHVYGVEHNAEGDLWMCAPGLAPDDRVALWEGVPPAPVPDHPALAPIALEGDLEGRRAYAERVPNGARWSQLTTPVDLRPYVVARVLDALAALHEVGEVHGAVSAGCVMLGPAGEVVLFGRGRRGGLASMDIIAALALLHDDADQTLPGDSAASAAAEVRRRVGEHDQARLASLVRGRVLDDPSLVDQLVLSIETTGGSADEVVPDFGPDSEGEGGLLDRWSVTTGSGREPTDEITDGDGTGAHRLALALWSRLAVFGEEQAPVERFAAVEGVASRGIRALLADEPPDPLPAALFAQVPPLVGLLEGNDMAAVEDFPTSHGMDPPSGTGLEEERTAVTRSPNRDPESAPENTETREVTRPPELGAGARALRAQRGMRVPWLEILVGTALLCSIGWLVWLLL